MFKIKRRESGQNLIANFSVIQMTFQSKLLEATGGKLGVCVGLDPVVEKMPKKFHNSKEPLYEYNLDIIEATHDIAAAYKPNLAFYEAHGASGWNQLLKTIEAIPDENVVIGDAKRGDIGSTAVAYAKALFNNLGCDAATVSPYLGSDSLEPFVVDENHGIFALAVTTNPSGAELQQLICNGIPLFRHVIRMVKKININRNIGLVVGATKPELFSTVLKEAEDLPLLIPGVGSQGGDIERLLNNLSGYSAPVFVNSSRGIIYASDGEDYKKAAHNAAEELRDQLHR